MYIGAYFRGYQYTDVLRERHNIEIRNITKLDFKPVKGWEGSLVSAVAEGQIELDVEPVEWADVVMFRRYYNTAIKCGDWKSPEYPGCGFTTRDEEDAHKHEHGFHRQDDLTRLVWPLFRDTWTGGVVYETDDDHWNVQRWNGYYPDVVIERDLIREMAVRADILTVSTPALGQRYSVYNKNIRVVRNSIDPELYIKDTERPDDPKVRLVYYGSTARLRDYAGVYITGNKRDGGYAFEAVEANKRYLTRVFLGTNHKTEDLVGRFFDEQVPYISGIAAFSKSLANMHGDIGIAPLAGDAFDRCKSELHWLEYAMSDMAFIGQRFNGEGPYQVVRDGVDGLLARGSQEWHDAVKRLATSPQLRADLAGAAKERVLAEYDYRDRAAEWADIFRYAAEHARGPLKAAA